MKNKKEIYDIAIKLKLNNFIGKKVITNDNHNNRPGEVAEIVGWSFDSFCLNPTEKLELFFHLCARFSDGEILPISKNFEEMGYKIIN